MMLEIKSPFNPHVRKRYRVEETIKTLHNLIQAHQVAKFCVAHSFDHEALKLIEKVNDDFVTSQS